MAEEQVWGDWRALRWDRPDAAHGWIADRGQLYRHVGAPQADPMPAGDRRSDLIRARYTVWLANGEQVDSSGETPAELPLSQLFLGWQQMIPLMNPGDIVQVIVPPHLGAGDRQLGPVPPGSTLHFVIQLVDRAG